MKKITSLLLALILLLSLCGCGSNTAKDAAAPAAMSGAYYSEPAADSYYAEEVSAYGLGMANAAVTERKEAGGEAEAPDVSPEKIIYSADVKVETTEFEDSVAKLEELLSACGGWVQSSSVNGADFYNQSRGYRSTRSAKYTLRIPSAKFDEMMNSLSALGNIPYTNTYTENVTSQYYDTEAHLKAYQTQETRLLEMMEIAETVEDIVILEDRLTELRYKIESLQSTLNNWDRRVSYSTVNLSIQEVVEYTPEPELKVSYGQRLWRSLTDGLAGVAEFFADLLVWLVGALPTLVILAALVLLLRKPVAKFFARRKEKREAKKAEKQTRLSANKAEKSE